MKFGLIILMLMLSINAYSQGTIDIMVKGISDNKKDGAQKDRLEAIMDAKRQACEKAGLRIEAKTTVKNFQTVYDFIESQAEAVLMPGFQVMDIGYTEDGTYQVVLSGKLSSANENNMELTKFTILYRFWEKNLNKLNKHDIMTTITNILNNFPMIIDNEPIQKYQNNASIKINDVSRVFEDDWYHVYIAVTYEIPSSVNQFETE